MDLFNNTHANKVTTDKEIINRIVKYKDVIFSCPDFGTFTKNTRIPSVHLYANYCLKRLRIELSKPYIDKLEQLNKLAILAQNN